MVDYRTAILRELSRCRWQQFDDNLDPNNYGQEPPPSIWQSKSVTDILQYCLRPHSYFSKQYDHVIGRGAFLYDLLQDESSRNLLVKLIAFRILGYRRVKLSRNTPAYWQAIDGMRKLKIPNTAPLPVRVVDSHIDLSEFDLTPIGYDMSCYASEVGLASIVSQKQYEYHCESVHCKAEAGDIVIDAGACWGETSLYFAHEVGPQGTVLAFEFIPSNLATLRNNQRLNPQLKERIFSVPNPLWSSAGRKLFYVDWGPASRVTEDSNRRSDGMAETVTIDGTLERLGLPRVDFIKMDIEGAELAALHGAESSIRKHRPKLAISVYHSIEDMDAIPRYLAGLGLGYRFYLDHHTIYENETVLFCMPDRQ
jgi:FkbM family methyltransferase